MTKTRTKHKIEQVSDPREQDLARAKDQAKAQLDSITEMVKALKWTADNVTDEQVRAICNIQPNGKIDARDREATAADLNYTDTPLPDDMRDEAEQTIHEDALSVEVNSGWYVPGTEKDQPPCEYRILLCTGGPACQIIGNLSEYGEPETARIQYQDWFTPWTDYRLDAEQEETVLTYARCFYYGEG